MTGYRFREIAGWWSESLPRQPLSTLSGCANLAREPYCKVKISLIAFVDVPGPRAVVVEDGFFEERIVENCDHLAIAAMLGNF